MTLYICLLVFATCNQHNLWNDGGGGFIIFKCCLRTLPGIFGEDADMKYVIDF